MNRTPPRPAPSSEAFWAGGADGVLRITRCQACGYYAHPPVPSCPRCRGQVMAPEPVSGRGTVWSYTVNRYESDPGLPPPYVVALIELEEQEGLRIVTNVVGCEPESVAIGMPVSVGFERAGDAYVPVFAP